MHKCFRSLHNMNYNTVNKALKLDNICMNKEYNETRSNKIL